MACGPQGGYEVIQKVEARSLLLTGEQVTTPQTFISQNFLQGSSLNLSGIWHLGSTWQPCKPTVPMNMQTGNFCSCESWVVG